MNPTEQERLAALEAQMQQVHEDIAAIRVATERLLSIAHMGRGALWLALHVGAALGILASAYEAVRVAGKN
ncbi:MAG TPA: hypothetical protein VMA37_04730 [Acetobacteraceae bacterium]|nr:hypothetical protein [Acetobacteraceae bacterium]